MVAEEHVTYIHMFSPPTGRGRRRLFPSVGNMSGVPTTHHHGRRRRDTESG